MEGLKGHKNPGSERRAIVKPESGFNVLTSQSPSDNLFKTTTLEINFDDWCGLNFGRLGNDIPDHSSHISGPND